MAAPSENDLSTHIVAPHSISSPFHLKETSPQANNLKRHHYAHTLIRITRSPLMGSRPYKNTARSLVALSVARPTPLYKAPCRMERAIDVIKGVFRYTKVPQPAASKRKPA